MKKTLASTAYDELLKKIYDQELPDPERISEQQIMDMLGIGRTPVREAIRQLAADGLLDLNPGTFAKVHVFTDKENQDIGVVRLAIDTVSAPLVILNGSNRDFQNLMNITTQCQKAMDRGDIMERIRLDLEFHTSLIAISGNKELTDIQRRITKRILLLQIQRYNKHGDSFCDLTGHLDILQALNDRNSKACIDAMKHHLSHSYDTANQTREWNSVGQVLGAI